MTDMPRMRPFHRHNRRRERPGLRTRNFRKSLSNRESIQYDVAEGVSVARDCGIALPHELHCPSACPCSDYSWTGSGGAGSTDLEFEQRRLFGGEVGDDVSLLPAMLEVVLFLWGDIDYTDP